jgi:bifunctional non-homologous end joining protein LigD
MSPLRRYHAKRDFAVTPEPRGAGQEEKAGPYRFVVQRHAARNLHYDFRLELGGVLKSWAVTKVPSLDPATRRLAVAVEDHPLAYGTFEGTIPKGQYGGGIVQLWDRGQWNPQDDAAPAAALRKGHLDFVLHGKRMKGAWTLIRLQGSHWLLVKQKDTQARLGRPEALGRIRTSVKTGRTLEEIGRHDKAARRAEAR